MKWSLKMLFGILLFFIGVNILLGLLGIRLGAIFGLIIAALCLYFGYNKFNDREQPNKVGGSLLMGFGAIILLGKFHFLGGIIVACIVMYVGYQIIKGSQHRDANH
ncbi:MAG TPA: hypothetical protein GX525_04400 [Bacilli bacterium]|nr:hypothetical protein [Bacilli bacterium]